MYTILIGLQLPLDMCMCGVSCSVLVVAGWTGDPNSHPMTAGDKRRPHLNLEDGRTTYILKHTFLKPVIQ